MDINRDLPVLSSISNLKYFSNSLNEDELINVLSDIKHRIFPRPFERLSSLRDRSKKKGGGLVGIEIGVAAGEHAISLLENLNIERIYLIDPYEDYELYLEGKAHYGIDQLVLSETEVLARARLEKYRSKIIWLKKYSSEALNFIDEKVDFVYIDGNHQYEFVVEDIDNYFPLLKESGVLGGHDFYNGFQREHDGVINAVTSFSVSHGLQLRSELPDWWIEKSENG
jgi:hypothetical protein